MKVFVTGATGFVGSAVVQDLLKAGHRVSGLARSEAAARALKSAGAEAHHGDINDLESLRAGAAAADGVIHTAFNHDFTRFAKSCEEDRLFIEALASPLKGSARPLVVTSGTALVASGKLATEDTGPTNQANPRVASEQAAMAMAEQGINVSIVRLAPSVHGRGDHGFVPLLINLAREKGVAAYIGEGQNLWPGVARVDAGALYRLALEKGARGVRYHGAAEEGVPFRKIAEAIGRGLKLPVVSFTPDVAAAHFGWFSHFAQVSNPTSSEQTRALLGWDPRGPGLLSDIEDPASAYFSS